MLLSYKIRFYYGHIKKPITISVKYLNVIVACFTETFPRLQSLTQYITTVHMQKRTFPMMFKGRKKSKPFFKEVKFGNAQQTSQKPLS